MNSKKSGRRKFLKGGAAMAGLAVGGIQFAGGRAPDVLIGADAAEHAAAEGRRGAGDGDPGDSSLGYRRCNEPRSQTCNCCGCSTASRKNWHDSTPPGPSAGQR